MKRRRRLLQAAELVALTAAATVGIVWALPAAGIGLMLGVCLILQGIDARPLAWLARVVLGESGEGRADDRSEPPVEAVPITSLAHPLWVALIVIGCGAVAYLGEQDALGRGYEFIPAIVPFLLLPYAVPGVVRGGFRRSDAAPR